MLRSLKDLERYTVNATDGDVGKVVDFLLDDKRLIVRDLVVETGSFLEGRRVRVSPISFREADWSTHHFHLALTMDEVKNCPSVDVDKPVPRQHEMDDPGLHAGGIHPGGMHAGGRTEPPVEAMAKEPPGDGHLRSADRLHGYHILGSDEPIGHLEDFVVDDETWQVRYLVVDTSNWWFGKKVLISPRWASRISYEEREVYVDMSRQLIEHSPEWDANAAITRKYETCLYDYYGRPLYRAGDGSAESSSRSASHPTS